MDLQTFLTRARRASRRSPRYLAGRVMGEVRYRLRRPWSHIYPVVFTDRTMLRAAGASSMDALWQAMQQAPFFLSPSQRESWTPVFRTRYPEEATRIIEAADRVLRHDFDLLGSGVVNLGPALPWHTDFKSGREWALEYSPWMHYSELDRPSDIKIPWELSRCQHVTALGQAYWLTGDERYAEEFVAEVTDWIARNPWAHGVNWACAMDVALRAVSWIWGFYYLSGSAACASPGFRGSFLRSLWLHGEYVATHIERSDVNGNHYLCDGVGLVFLGAFFRGTVKGRRWLATGKDMVVAEIFNQTTSDGVDFEQSTAYHRLVLEAFLTSYLLLQLAGEQVPPEALVRLERMLEFVEAYVKPDGTVPLVGDADDGRIQKLGQQGLADHRYLLSAGAVLFGRADFKRGAGRFWDESFWTFGPDAAHRFDEIPQPLAPIESKAFPEGGFYVLRSSRAHVMIDCGEVGMQGRGGHGHSDITSVEVWLDGMNLVTDCGAYLYTASREWRNRFRSTEFHNVVQVDDEELNRLITPDHLWQLRDDARPQGVEWRCGGDVDYFRGGHTGYARLDPPVAVSREVLLIKDGSGDDVEGVLIRDVVDGRGTRDLTWRFHLDASVKAAIDGDAVRLSRGGRDMWLQPAESLRGLRVQIEPGWVSPSYGVRREIQVIVIRGRVDLPRTASFRFGSRLLSRNQLTSLSRSGRLQPAGATSA